MQVLSIDKSIGSLEQEIVDTQGKIQAAHSSMAAAAALRKVGRGGRKGGRGAAAAPIEDLAPMPMPVVAPAAPMIPPHFVPFTFRFPGKPEFTVRARP